jgi:hypothetical protein
MNTPLHQFPGSELDSEKWVRGQENLHFQPPVGMETAPPAFEPFHKPHDCPLFWVQVPTQVGGVLKPGVK